MSCNNYDIIDLGVMVPAEQIVKKAIEEKVDAIGLSGLITPSLEEMVHTAQEMQKAGLAHPYHGGRRYHERTACGIEDRTGV